MVVVPPIRDDLSDTEVREELVQRGDALSTLRYRELVRYLVSGPVARSTRAAYLPHETDREASFSVYKTNHPTTELNQSFLLVFRTRHFVTVDVVSDATSSARYTGFPAYSQMHTAPLPTRGAT